MARRRAGFDDGRGHGRAAAAQQLMDQLTGRTTGGRDWSQPVERPAHEDRSLEQLISDRGSVSQLARDMGVARTTVQRWRNRGTTPRGGSREKLDRINQQVTADKRRTAAQREWGQVADRLGGAKGLAAAAGVTTSTANKWLAGTSSPSVGSQAALQQADTAWRISQTQNLTLGAGGAPPPGDIRLQVHGTSVVRGNSDSPEDLRTRDWGSTGGGLPYSGDAPGGFDQFWNAATSGDSLGALDALQEYMTGQTNCSHYDPDTGAGVLFDDIEGLDLSQPGGELW